MESLFLLGIGIFIWCKYLLPLVQTKVMKEKSEERIERLAKVGKVVTKVGGEIAKRWLK